VVTAGLETVLVGGVGEGDALAIGGGVRVRAFGDLRVLVLHVSLLVGHDVIAGLVSKVT